MTVITQQGQGYIWHYRCPAPCAIEHDCDHANAVIGGAGHH